MFRPASLGLLLFACSDPAWPGPPSKPSQGWSELVAAPWTIAPGTERYPCFRLTLEENTYVAGYRPLTPQGTHHMVAVIGAPAGPDGPFECTDFNVNTNAGLLFGAGIGTDDFIFPNGVAVYIPAGTQITLNLHLFNTGTQALSGRSGVLVERVDAATVRELAVLSLGGSPNLQPIPPSNVPTTATGHCQFAADATIIDLFPHMHRIGRHMTVSNGSALMLDTDFSFTEQHHYPRTLAMHAGDVVSFTCTWLNDTGATVEPGKSSTEEMCVLGMYVFPAGAVPVCEHL